MAAFLSDGWIQEMNEALSCSTDLGRDTGGVSLSIQQIVRVNDGERCYAVRIDHGRVTVEAGRIRSADVTVTEDVETATALAQGRMSPQTALMLGRVRVTGDMAALVASYECLLDRDDLLAPVRDRTTY